MAHYGLEESTTYRRTLGLRRFVGQEYIFRPKPHQQRHPWASMEVGSEIFIAKTLASTAMSLAYRWAGRRGLPWRFKSRKADGGTFIARTA